MASMQHSVLIFVVLAAFVSSAFAIHCYQCESGTNEKCGEKFNPDGVEKYDCSSSSTVAGLLQKWSNKNATGCMKTVNEIIGKRHIVRACYFGDVKLTSSGCDSNLDINAPGFKQISCDVCTGNLCNGSSTTGPIALTIALFALVAHMLY